MTRLPSIGVQNFNNELPSIMIRLPFIGVTNLYNELTSIMTRLPSIGIIVSTIVYLPQ